MISFERLQYDDHLDIAYPVGEDDWSLIDLERKM